MRKPLSRRSPFTGYRKMVRRLRMLMRERQINASKLAAEAGRGNTAIYDIIDGKSTDPHASVIEGIAWTLGVSPAYLAGWSDDR